MENNRMDDMDQLDFSEQKSISENYSTTDHGCVSRDADSAIAAQETETVNSNVVFGTAAESATTTIGSGHTAWFSLVSSSLYRQTLSSSLADSEPHNPKNTTTTTTTTKNNDDRVTTLHDEEQDDQHNSSRQDYSARFPSAFNVVDRPLRYDNVRIPREAVDPPASAAAVGGQPLSFATLEEETEPELNSDSLSLAPEDLQDTVLVQVPLLRQHDRNSDDSSSADDVVNNNDDSKQEEENVQFHEREIILQEGSSSPRSSSATGSNGGIEILPAIGDSSKDSDDNDSRRRYTFRENETVSSIGTQQQEEEKYPRQQYDSTGSGNHNADTGDDDTHDLVLTQEQKKQSEKEQPQHEEQRGIENTEQTTTSNFEEKAVEENYKNIVPVLVEDNVECIESENSVSKKDHLAQSTHNEREKRFAFLSRTCFMIALCILGGIAGGSGVASMNQKLVRSTVEHGLDGLQPYLAHFLYSQQTLNAWWSPTDPVLSVGKELSADRVVDSKDKDGDDQDLNDGDPFQAHDSHYTGTNKNNNDEGNEKSQSDATARIGTELTHHFVLENQLTTLRPPNEKESNLHEHQHFDDRVKNDEESPAADAWEMRTREFNSVTLVVVTNQTSSDTVATIDEMDSLLGDISLKQKNKIAVGEDSTTSLNFIPNDYGDGRSTKLELHSNDYCHDDVLLGTDSPPWDNKSTVSVLTIDSTVSQLQKEAEERSKTEDNTSSHQESFQTASIGPGIGWIPLRLETDFVSVLANLAVMIALVGTLFLHLHLNKSNNNNNACAVDIDTNKIASPDLEPSANVPSFVPMLTTSLGIGKSSPPSKANSYYSSPPPSVECPRCSTTLIKFENLLEFQQTFEPRGTGRLTSQTKRQQPQSPEPVAASGGFPPSYWKLTMAELKELIIRLDPTMAGPGQLSQVPKATRVAMLYQSYDKALKSFTKEELIQLLEVKGATVKTTEASVTPTKKKNASKMELVAAALEVGF